MRRTGMLLAGLILLAVSSSADTTETIFLRADLSTANEVPPVPGVTASGRATIYAHARRNDAGAIVSGVVDFDVDYTFAEAVSINGLHVHVGPAGANGAVVIDSGIRGSSAVAAQGSGRILRAVSVDSGAALDAFKDLLVNPGNYYVNLHTTTHPDGLIRAQLRVSPPPPPSVIAADVMNNASYRNGPTPMAPGSIVAIFGTRVTDGTACIQPTCFPRLESDGKLNRTLAGAQVTVNGVAVPILYGIHYQLGIQVPYELSGTSATVRVTVAGQSSSDVSIPIAPLAPGIFFTTASDGKAIAAVTHANGSAVTAQNPAQPGEVVILYATGLGQVTPAVPTGALPSGETRTVTTPTVSIDGVPAVVQFSGLSGCCVGLNQLNVVIPPGSRTSSDLSIVLNAGGVQSNTATIAVGTPSGSSNPAPAISSLSPATIQAGASGRTLTIIGTGFTAASTATFNGVAKTVTFVSDTMLTIQLTDTDLAQAGSYAVVVINPAPGGGTSNVVNLSITRPPPDDPNDPYDDDY